MPLEAQAKVLRVLQNGEFERVGSTKTRKTDLRVIAATNKNLELEAQKGAFRKDLYHRLSVFPLHVPPLRERREDIPLLTSFLLTRKARRLGRIIDRVPKDVMAHLIAYEWPGNVRELENVLERAIILSPDTTLRAETIHLGIPAGNSTQAPPLLHQDGTDATGDASLHEHEHEHIRNVCEHCSWKIKGPDGAAQVLGLNPATLYSRMKKLGIKRPAH
jgi:transcriptional regulator with GAF, ATPase, and Fis domain